MNRLFIIMGVSGSGKTTLGIALSKKLGIPFFDADDFHPESNVQKMSSGNPLTDEDRIPWLKKLNVNLIQWSQEDGAILACSALKESYRKLLSEHVDITWVYLKADANIIQKRMEKRQGHFMPVSLLQSQFDTLEEPSYGMHFSVSLQPKTIINKLLHLMSKQTTSAIGVFGLGVMGKSLAYNMLDHNIPISVYNRKTPEEQHIVSNFLEEASNQAKGFTDLEGFVNSLESPRKIILMIPAGKPIDMVIEQLLPLLDSGDLLIDGGNSHFKDSERRLEFLNQKGIHFIGIGVSGGEEGARKGPSLMPGGNLDSYQKIAPILEIIAAKDQDNNPCCTYIGDGGAGHFVKMVHNGIEYGEMQLLAEMFELLSKSMNYEEISNLFSAWNQGYLSNYLLEITAAILKEQKDDVYVLDTILDKAGNKGTGAWSSISALENGVATPIKMTAVLARYTSSLKEDRKRLSAFKNISEDHCEDLDTHLLKQAYDFARTLNMHQGLELIKKVSEEKSWNIELPNVLQVWSNGCIIKSKKLEEWKQMVEESSSLLNHEPLLEKLQLQEPSVVEVLHCSLKNRVSLPCFSSALQYWIAMTTENSSANMIQAQRDFFGAHTFENRNTGEITHHNWTTQ